MGQSCREKCYLSDNTLHESLSITELLYKIAGLIIETSDFNFMISLLLKCELQ